MKVLFITSFIFLTINIYAQEKLTMSEVESRKLVSMADVTASSTDGTYRYYAKGSEKPFTGILYSKFENGNFDSYQEYVDGVGQGKWINYYENGNYKEIGNYDQNKVTGSIKKYHENGQLAAEGQYKDWRIRIGSWDFYSATGEFIESIDYGEKGSIVEVQEYYESGEISYSWYSRILAENGF